VKSIIIISLHFSFVKKQRTETSKMIALYVKVIFFCFNIKYSMVFIEYMLRWIGHSLSATSHRAHYFSEINISQGSVVMRLRCGGIVNNHCIANFSEIVTVKEFLKSVNIWRSYVYNIWGSLFLAHPVYCLCIFSYRQDRISQAWAW